MNGCELLTFNGCCDEARRPGKIILKVYIILSSVARWSVCRDARAAPFGVRHLADENLGFERCMKILAFRYYF